MVKKLKMLYISDHMIWFKCYQHVVQVRTVPNNVGRTLDFRGQHLHGKVVMANLLQKLILPIGSFYVTIIDAHIGCLKSLHTLFDKYLATSWRNVNQIV